MKGAGGLSCLVRFRHHEVAFGGGGPGHDHVGTLTASAGEVRAKAKTEALDARLLRLELGLQADCGTTVRGR
jgi:hypothetical protein